MVGTKCSQSIYSNVQIVKSYCFGVKNSRTKSVPLLDYGRAE
jgi:hypothetical protein